MQQNQYEQVVFDKRNHRNKGETKTTQVNRALRTGNVVAEKKYGAGGNRNTGTDLNTKTLDEDMESLKHQTVSLSLKKTLQQERLKAKMSQKDLATACSMKTQVIQDYEAGKGIPSSSVLRKIESALKQRNPEFQPGTLTKAQKGTAAKKKKPAATATTRGPGSAGTTRRRF